MNAIYSEAAAPALARIADLERQVRMLSAQLYHAELALAIVEPEDVTARLPDGSEVAVSRDLWAEAVSRTIRNNAHEYHEILDALAARQYSRR